jgi:YjbE family integral membrane protein
MELSPELVSFTSALAAIIVIDLMLAGDNAIMIALAARNVPKHMQRRVILWGTGGAIAVRVAMTLAVVWLLKIPGLAGAGGLLLLWIAYRLLVHTDTDADTGERSVHTADSFWGAMRLIVVADAVMGLDNVLGVAGAAQGSWLLVTLGLLISIPIVVWGSSLLLHWIQRFPVIIYLGAGVLAWTAAMMIVGEPLIQDHLAAQPALRWIIYAASIVGVLGIGYLRQRSAAAKAQRAMDV